MITLMHNIVETKSPVIRIDPKKWDSSLKIVSPVLAYVNSYLPNLVYMLIIWEGFSGSEYKSGLRKIQYNGDKDFRGFTLQPTL